LTLQPYYNILCRTLREERKLQIQMEDLQLRIKKLRRYGKALDEKSRMANWDGITAFEAYAKNECREFCNKVHKTFPREIRDIIYGYVTDTNNVAVSEPASKSKKSSRPVTYFGSTSETQLRLCDYDEEADHWWDETFVGAEMVREIGENFYRTTCFQFEDKFDLIPKFRVTDQWNLGFIPAAFVSNVEVSINCDAHEFKKDDEDPWATAAHGWGWDTECNDRVPKAIPRSSILVHLESLFGFRPGTNITIEITMDRYRGINSDERQEFMCENIVPFLFPTLLRLRDTGLRVRFKTFVIMQCAWGDDILRVFTSAWNPASVDEFTKNFFEVSKV
jgi:hypothetical protein